MSRHKVIRSFYRTSTAKCILTGEHSVISGTTAVCFPVPLSLKSRILYTQDNIFKIQINNTDLKIQFTKASLINFVDKKRKLYQKFRNGEIEIEEVLNERYDLVSLTLGYLVESLYNLNGLTLQIYSNIPWKSGLGSSAALITSILRHLCAPHEKILSLSQEIESFQHGLSSGLDPATCLSKKTVIKRSDNFLYYEVDSQFWDNFLLINTGQPETTSGECVSHSQRFFEKNPTLLQDFEKITSSIACDIENFNYNSLGKKISYNNQLLYRLGVVPEKVQFFIEQLNKQGIYSKICGAGSLRGDSAGLLLIESSLEAAQPLIQKFGYDLIYTKNASADVSIEV